MTRVKVKCSRTKCLGTAHRYGLCTTHHKASPHGYVPADDVRAHINRMRGRGCGLKHIAALTGVNHTTIGYISSGELRTIKRRTADAIMAVPAPSRFVDGGGLAPAVGTARRIRALCAIGYTQSMIAERYGVHLEQVSKMLRNTYVTARWVARIAEVFDEWQMTPGPSVVMRKRAATLGWPPPLAWDEDTIDDPTAQPYATTQTRAQRAAELAERIADERWVGRDDHQVAEVWGLKVETLQQRLRRADIPRTGTPATVAGAS